MGALIGLRLTKQISFVLEIPMKDATFWVNSKNILYWIQGRSRNYKSIVSHRVGKIDDESSPEQWKYVSTEFNPADFGTCGLRFRGKPATQQMAPLPCIRLEVTMKPFMNCTVHYAGPYLTVQGRGKSREKRYLCLFLCLQTHCVHLEMAWSLETDGFLKVLTRMVA